MTGLFVLPNGSASHPPFANHNQDKQMPQISVVILTWNRKDELAQAVDSVMEQKGVTFEVILVDSASTDGTSELIQSRYPSIRYIRLPYNLGVTGGRNIGMANAQGEVMFLLDDDAILPRTDILRIGYDHFQRDPQLGVLFGTIYNYFTGRIEMPVGEQSPTHSWFRSYYTFNFRGVAEFIRRSLLEEIGYFERLFFREVEERDFSLRVLAAGKRILYTPEIQVRHRISAERYYSPQIQSQKLSHELITLWTYYPWIDATLFGAWDIVSSAVRSLRAGWFLHYLGCLISFLFWQLPYTLVRRRKPFSRELIQHVYALATRTISDPEDLREARTSLFSYCCNHLQYLLRKGSQNEQRKLPPR